MMRKLAKYLVIIHFLTLPSCEHRETPTSEMKVTGPKAAAVGMNNFTLMKWDGKSWQVSPSVSAQPNGVNIIIHGFNRGNRKGPCNYLPDEVFVKHGLQDFRYENKFVPPPPQIKGDTYALMWDSRAGTPMELESLLMVAPKKTKAELEKLIDSDHVEDETDTEFFKNLLNFYLQIMKSYKGPKPHIAGFSKGGHVAIKLAEYAHFKQTNATIMPESIALLDAYVGPGWSNNNIGIKLLAKIKALQQKNVSFLNIMTSEIYDISLLGVPMADTRFRDDLRRAIGEINFKRNIQERDYLGGRAPVTGNKNLDQIILNHARAPQIWYGSVLLCDQFMPTINSSPDEYRKVYGKYLKLETPREITDWIYSGVINPQCNLKIATE